jgi:hypothetical protein
MAMPRSENGADESGSSPRTKKAEIALRLAFVDRGRPSSVEGRVLSQLDDLVLELQFLALQLVDFGLIAQGMMHFLLELFLERLVTTFEFDEMAL